MNTSPSIVRLILLSCCSFISLGHVAAQEAVDGSPSEKQGIRYTNQERFISGVGMALATERYDLLEQTVAPMRTGSVEFISGMPRLRTFYEGLMTAYVTDTQKAANLQAWREAYPKSKAALLASSQFHIVQAWRARGQGFANTVTEEGGRGFREHMEQAASYLAQSKALPELDPDYYAQQIEVAKCLAWSREEVDAIVAELLEKAPKYYPAHCSMVEYLLPRWHGEPGEMEGYAMMVAQTLKGEIGAIVYARIAERVRRYYPASEFFERTDFEYEIIRTGLAARLKMSPDLLPLRHLLCYFACQKFDMATAHEQFEYLTEHKQGWSKAAWKDAEEFERWRELASNVEAFTEPHTFSVQAFPNGSIHAAFLTDNRRVVASHPRSEVRLFDASNGEYLDTIHDLGKYRSGMNSFTRYGHRLWIDLPADRSLNEQPPSSAMLILPLPGQGEDPKQINFPGMDFHNYAFSDDGLRFASHPKDHVFCLGNLEDATQNRIVKLPSAGGWPAFSPDGTRLVVFTRQQPLLLDTATGQPVATKFPPLQSSLTQVFFSADGKLLYFCGSESTIVWDLAKEEQLAEHAEPKEILREYAAVVSRDRRWIATRVDNSVVIWDVEKWQEAYRSPQHATGIQTLAFSHDSSKLVAGSSRLGLIKVWDLTKILPE